MSAFCVTLVTLAANAVYLLRVRTNNPLQYYSGLGSPTSGITSGAHTIDANEGWTAQALGRVAAQMWQHGHVPLWNYFEGLGQPLAGEMQSAALFQPFVSLNLLPNGIFFMHLALEFVAAFGTLLFLRSLRVSWTAATAGACLFGLNGVFSLMTNAPFNPIAFLPVAMWGVELIIAAVQQGRRPRLGLWVTALAVAYMLFAGFPETALLEGLFVTGWLAVRLVALGGHRRSVIIWSVVAAVAGVAIAAPILISFKEFLDFGNTAYHSGAANAYSYKTRMINSVALPYGVGPMSNSILKEQAGYVTLPAVLIGLVGAMSTRRRLLQAFLAFVAVVLLLNMFGFMPVKEVLNVLPGVRNILVAKYGLVLIEFAVVICVAFGIDDLRRSRVNKWAVAIAVAVVTGYLAHALVFAARRDLFTNTRWTSAMLVWTVGACVVLTGVLLLSRSSARRAGLLAIVATLIVITDAAGTYAVPQLSASPRNPVDLAPVRYLQTHLGTSRFYTLGPISPNYGSYFGIASINANDLPVPKKYSSFLMDNLRPAPGTPGSRGTRRSFISYQLVAFNPGVKTQRVLFQAYGQQQKYFQAASAEYIVMRRGVATASSGAKYGLSRVFRDARFEIWRDPKAAPYYSTSGAKCSVRKQSFSGVTLNCPAPATLLRRSLSTPDWTVTINGKDRAVADSPGRLFQSVPVPAGVSKVSYSYVPQHFKEASALSLATVALMLADGGAFLVLRRRETRRRLVG